MNSEVRHYTAERGRCYSHTGDKIMKAGSEFDSTKYLCAGQTFNNSSDNSSRTHASMHTLYSNASKQLDSVEIKLELCPFIYLIGHRFK